MRTTGPMAFLWRNTLRHSSAGSRSPEMARPACSQRSKPMRLSSSGVTRSAATALVLRSRTCHGQVSRTDRRLFPVARPSQTFSVGAITRARGSRQPMARRTVRLRDRDASRGAHGRHEGLYDLVEPLCLATTARVGQRPSNATANATATASAPTLATSTAAAAQSFTSLIFGCSSGCR